MQKDAEKWGHAAVPSRARCPYHQDQSLQSHKLWSSTTDGDLIQCKRDPTHYWVRPPFVREQDREENGGHL